MYQSLLTTCPAFNLYIFAFDDITYQILTEQNLVNTTIISLNNFETIELLAIKADRSTAEYCWTCTPFIIKHCIDNFNLDHCTYIDADTYFYNDPTALINEMGNNSVLITPHNYYPLYDQSAMSGIYCVQFVTFKNTIAGLKVLNWWAQACLTWCYARFEDGKMGDQKYLDSWPYMFNEVYICRNIGAGLAPWNLLNYTYKNDSNPIIVNDTSVIFYHFHDLKYLSNNSWYLGGYEVPDFVLENIYKPYMKLLLILANDFRKQNPGVDTLNTVAIQTVNDFDLKYKVGSYLMDLKKSSRQFIADLFFISKSKKHKNYIKLK